MGHLILMILALPDGRPQWRNIIIMGKEGRISHRSFLMTGGLYVLYELS